MRLDEIFHATIQYPGFELLSPKRSKAKELGQMGRVWQKIINVNPAERDQCRSWGRMDGANKQLAAEATKKPEGWKRDRGLGVGCPVRFHVMPLRFALELLKATTQTYTKME